MSAACLQVTWQFGKIAGRNPFNKKCAIFVVGALWGGQSVKPATSPSCWDVRRQPMKARSANEKQRLREV